MGLFLLLPQWDEALLTMSKGETARLEIEPEWAYGKKGVPDSKYPFLFIWKVTWRSGFDRRGFVLTHLGMSLSCWWYANISLIPVPSEFHLMQSWFLKWSWCPWIEYLPTCTKCLFLPPPHLPLKDFKFTPSLDCTCRFTLRTNSCWQFQISNGKWMIFQCLF